MESDGEEDGGGSDGGGGGRGGLESEEAGGGGRGVWDDGPRGVSERCKAAGNALYRSRDFARAVDLYTQVSPSA
jgi:hypothetical protein